MTSVERSQRDGAVIVVASGEFDAANCRALDTEINAAIVECSTLVEIDMSAVTFMDSSALSALLRTWHTAAAARVAMSITAASPRVRQLFEISGLSGFGPFP